MSMESSVSPNSVSLELENLRKFVDQNSQQLNNLGERAVSVPEFVRNATALLNISKNDLERLISAPTGYLDDIEGGRSPSLTFIRELSDALKLSERASRNLTNVRQANLLISDQFSLVQQNIAAQKLEQDVQQLVALLLKARSTQEDVPPELIERAAERVIEQGERLAAPIRLPRTEDMEVRLASIGQLERLDEYRGNLNFFYGAASCALGGILGIVVNWVTQEPIHATPASLMAIGLLAMVFIVFAYLSRRESNRAVEVRDQILGKSQKHFPEKNDTIEAKNRTLS